MRAVRVNGQITEVKQLSMVNNGMGDHLGSIHFVNLPNLTNQLEFGKNSIDLSGHILYNSRMK